MDLLFVLKRKYRRGPRLFAPQVQRTRVHAHRERVVPTRTREVTRARVFSPLGVVQPPSSSSSPSRYYYTRGTLASFKYTPHYVGSYFFFFLRVKESHTSPPAAIPFIILFVFTSFSLSLSLSSLPRRELRHVTKRHNARIIHPNATFSVCVCVRARKGYPHALRMNA